MNVASNLPTTMIEVIFRVPLASWIGRHHRILPRPTGQCPHKGQLSAPTRANHSAVFNKSCKNIWSVVSSHT